MRGEASRIADRVSRDSLAPKLRNSGEDAWRIGNELFTITSALDHNIQLERALTDPSRPVEDKVAVVKTLIGNQAHPLVMEIIWIWLRLWRESGSYKICFARFLQGID